MPVFKIDGTKVKQLKKDFFSKERGLQNFCENNLLEIFGVRFIKTEHVTGEKHAGRIDSLGLDEDGNPVIIEYKKREDENIINQGLFYLDWLIDHKGDFTVLAQNKLGTNTEISWDQPRVILIANSYSKYDKHAINQMPQNLELWSYILYENGVFSIERVGDSEIQKEMKPGKKYKDKNADKKFNLEYHRSKSTKELVGIYDTIRERILELSGVEERSEQKSGVSYKTTKSFARFEFNKNSINMLVRSAKYIDPKKLVRDVTSFEWGYKGSVKIIEKMDADELFWIVKQSYEETL
ncbi:MAG TPA: DUF5655 domain-containing protein, partial [Candidatus Goldiibacteriota bacterium]|nr:DUF5655 domain-containing protein [Candidatus Goldiibacteriota bacterium]